MEVFGYNMTKQEALEILKNPDNYTIEFIKTAFEVIKKSIF